MPLFRLTLTSAALAALAIAPAHADSVEDFYKGKTVSLVIGYSVGGGYDLYGRLVARHMAKYIPGKPTIVPQNMTGAGSFRAASFLYAAAPKDGTVFGTFGRTIATMPLLVPVSAPVPAVPILKIQTPFDGPASVNVVPVNVTAAALQ